MKKSEALEQWKSLPEAPPGAVLAEMVPIPYRATGSSYGACGIRIDGTPAFVDAVLSRLKDLIDGENQVTRLELARKPVKATEINGQQKEFHKKAPNAEVCYIRLHVRGREGAIAAAVFDTHLAEATERFAQLQGLLSTDAPA